MQIRRTEVARVTLASGKPILRVRFCGEGDDCVTVDMSDVEEYSDAAILDYAKAILVQTATFDAAANEYEAVSNGNFDEVAVTAVTDENAGMYIFEYRDGDGSRQVPPSQMPSLQAAQSEALRGAIDLLSEMQRDAAKPAGWLVRVRDLSGRLIYTVDSQQAVSARTSKVAP